MNQTQNRENSNESNRLNFFSFSLSSHIKLSLDSNFLSSGDDGILFPSPMCQCFVLLFYMIHMVPNVKDEESNVLL